MTVEAGQNLLHYRLVEKIGEGGMGVVWKAVDTTLDREVAIKILPDVFAQDAERLARFEREAQLLASLNHAHIASIHGLEQSDTLRFLVLEFVGGEDLAQRLKRGPIPVAETIEIGQQIADALEQAHEQGVVHRDLKPANIKVDADGQVKVLDFGLAKALESEVGPSSPDLTQSPTWMATGTVEGVILGTAAYMSPEQARGKRVDRRSDIWAFGCVMFEMLTGRTLFAGETVSDTMAAVLRAEPEWETLPEATPPGLRRLLERCLERDVRRRLQSIGEARIALEDVAAGRTESESLAVAPAPPKSRSPWAWAVAGVVLGALAAFFALRFASAPDSAPVAQSVRLEIPVEPSEEAPRFELDRQGTKVVYSVSGKLYVRPLDQIESRQVPNVEAATACAWSPDGTWITYTTGPKLYKIRPDGTQRFQVCEVPDGIHARAGGMVWLEDGRIVFLTGDTGLQQVSDQGGTPSVLLDPEPDELDFHVLSVLPEDRGFLFVAHSENRMDTVVLFAGGQRSNVVTHPGDYIGTADYTEGHVIYNRRQPNPGLWAVPFSLETLQPTGDPFVLVPEGREFHASHAGHIVYRIPTDEQRRELVVLNGSGRVTHTVIQAQTGLYPNFSVSPDGKQVAVTLLGEDEDIWLFDVESGVRQRFVFGKERQRDPAWSPKGDEIVYIEGILGEARVFARNVSGTTTRELPAPATDYVAFSRDGRYLVMEANDAALDRHVAYMAVDDREPTVFADTPLYEGMPALAPGNRYIAYQTNQSGQNEIFVRSFPDGESVWQVSEDGGAHPYWSADGTRLYFRKGARLMEVAVELDPVLRLGPPRVRFEDDALVQVVPTGKPDEFMAVRRVRGDERPPSLTVWLNWTAGLASR